jgi:hypothetical protein
VILLVLLLAVLAAPAAASPADDLAPLDGVASGECAALPVPAQPPTAVAAAGGPSVRATIRDAAAKDAIPAGDAARYEELYAAALRTRDRLGGTRRAELDAVIRQLETFARQRTLTASRMPVVFLTLEQNTAWWSAHSPPPPPKPSARPCAGGTGVGGARVVRGETVFQWYSGQGLQVMQLATAGRANALVKACIEPNPQLACDRDRVRAAMDGLLALSARRSGSRAWEAYFAFGGGRPPWVSGLWQGTAIQALARGAQVLGDPAYLQAAREGLGIFKAAPPAGVRVRAGAGVHYLGYSFAPGLRIYNQFLQALVGIYDVAEIADDDEARALFRDGERRARQELAGADTGAWSRYSANGHESDLGYHQLLRDFLRSMCERTKIAVYCGTAERFQGYLHEKPALRFLPGGAVKARRATAARFFVTKVGCVTLTVSRDGHRVATVTRVLGRGTRSIAWVPPRAGGYRVAVQARDLAGNVGRISATVRAAG